MTWAKLDDQFHAHRKAKIAWKKHPRALGLHLLAISYCAGHLTDGFVDFEFVEEKIPGDRQLLQVTDALIEAGLWASVDGGWQINDFLEYNPSKEEVERTRSWDRKRKTLERDRPLIDAIRERDGDRCRYCGVAVNWRDRRGATGGTYDHVEPRGDNSLANVVVACRGCNMKKHDRTPEAAGMPLLPAGRIGSSRPAKSDLAGPSRGSALPDPTRPDLSQNPPSPPQAGGRKRDREKQENDVVTWAARIGVQGPRDSIVRAIRQCDSCTHEQFRSFCQTHFAATLTVTDPPLRAVGEEDAA